MNSHMSENVYRCVPFNSIRMLAAELVAGSVERGSPKEKRLPGLLQESCLVSNSMVSLRSAVMADIAIESHQMDLLSRSCTICNTTLCESLIHECHTRVMKEPCQGNVLVLYDCKTARESSSQPNARQLPYRAKHADLVPCTCQGSQWRRRRRDPMLPSSAFVCSAGWWPQWQWKLHRIGFHKPQLLGLLSEDVDAAWCKGLWTWPRDQVPKEYWAQATVIPRWGAFVSTKTL